MINLSLKEGWKGFLSFSFVQDGQRTVVKDKRHFGPLVLQRPYYQEIARPQVLIIHPPGGIVGGDVLETHIKVTQGAQGLISTPAATKFYRSKSEKAYQLQKIEMDVEGELEWLPQETLFFNRSVSDNKIIFKLASANNKLIAWDIIGLGRPHSGERFEQGELSQSIELFVEDELIFVDRLHVTPESGVTDSVASFDGKSLFATAMLYSPDIQTLGELKAELNRLEWPLPVGITQMDRLIVLRVLGEDLDEIKEVLYQLWVTARPLILGVSAIRPRIWNT